MMRTMAVKESLRRGRMEAKTRDAMFRARIEQGAKCAPFVSAAILQTLKDVYPVDADDLAAQVELGRVRMLVVAAHEPSGKKLGECQKVSVLLTLDQPDDDDVRVHQGVTGLRRARLLRMTVEAFEQGGLLTHEDLASRLLNCGLRTIVRDVEQLRGAGLAVPTRGQQQDIGPGQTHRVQAVKLFLKGLEPREIARRLYHSLSAIENYVTTFSRVVLLASRGHVDDEIAFVLKRSATLVRAYRELHSESANDRGCQRRLQELTQKLSGSTPPNTTRNAAEKGGARS